MPHRTLTSIIFTLRLKRGSLLPRLKEKGALSESRECGTSRTGIPLWGAQGQARLLAAACLTALLFLPQGALAQASATWQFRDTRCERRFELLEYPLFDPFGYRYTAPINLPGIGPRHRIVECAYLGPGGAGGKFVIGGFDGGDGDWDGRIDFSGYIDDLLREREERRGRDGDGDRDGDRDDVPDYLDADRAQPLMPQTGVDLY